MKGPGYPAGVPTPFTMHVNPYPTRFHGGIWSRPAFKFPQIQQTSTVFLPPRDIDMIPDRPPGGYSGLGNDQATDVGDGIFRPGGYVGGVFDGNLSGAPSLGSPQAKTLGDITATASDQANYPYGKYSAQTLQIQNSLNQKLLKYGFCPIIADGKLGPATCGAVLSVGGLDPGAPVSYPTTCQDTKFPNQSSAGCGTGPAVPTASKPTTAAMTPVTSSLPILSSNTKKVLGFLGGGLLAVGAVYYIKKRRG